MNSTAAALEATRGDKKIYCVGQAAFDRECLRIAPNGAASIDAARGAAIQCVAGRLWLTQEGDARDHIVPAGMTFCTDRAGRVVVSALDGASTIRVIARAPAHCVPGSVALDSIERFTQAARKAQAAYLSRLFARLSAWLATRARWMSR